MQNHSPAVLFCIALSISLVGCSVIPPYQRPTVDVTPTFSEAPQDWKVAQPQSVSLDPEWWKQFGDPTLIELENELVKSNFSLKVAEAQYRQVKAISDAAPLALLPTLSANITSTRRRNVNNTSSSVVPASASSTAPVVTTTSSSSSISTSSSALLSSQWEIDLWGKIRAEYASSLASTEASKDDIAQATLSLQSALATAYINARVVEMQLEKLKAINEAYKRIVSLTENRVNAGVANVADLELARGQFKASEAQYLSQLSTRAQQEHAIAVLLGKSPMSWKLPPLKSKDTYLGMQLAIIPAVVPSVLLERRPDIASAERKVASANAQIGVAKAAWFPTFSLGATLGSQSSQPWAKFFSLPGLVWSLGPTLAYPILDSGARYVQSEQARAGYDAAVSSYRQTALTAFQEVEDQLALSQSLQQEEAAQIEALAAVQRRVLSITQQFKAGTLSKLDIMNATTLVLDQENVVLLLRGQRLLNQVALVKAVGGGWRVE